jgi:hypothetical protein
MYVVRSYLGTELWYGRIIWALEEEIELNSVAWVGERTLPTERPLLVGEVTANSCGREVSRSQRGGSLQLYCRFLDWSRYFFFQVDPQFYSGG